MKNSLSSPKKVSVFHRYAPLLQGGWGEMIALSFMILLCGFTMSKFASVHLQGLQDFVNKETLDTTGIVFGGLFGAATIIHFAATFTILARDFIAYFKKDSNKVHYLREKVNVPVFILNLLGCALILGFDGYISLVGINNAITDIGKNLAENKYTTGTQQAESQYTEESSKDWQAWRTDSANIASLYANKVAATKSKAQGEIGDLKGKAARGAAAGSTSWAASLRGQAGSKEAQLSAKISQIEADKAQALLDRANSRDTDIRQKNGEKAQKTGLYLQNKQNTENQYKGYATGTWILSAFAYFMYIYFTVKHELIHIEAGIENEVQVQESYFRTSFAQNLRHELSEWGHDAGRVVINQLAKWRQGLHKKAVFRNLPTDAGDIYRQQVRFSSPVLSPTPVTNQVQEEPEEEPPMSIPYKDSGKIGFSLKETVAEKAPTLPTEKAENITKEVLAGERIRLTVYFKTVPPFPKEFDSREEAEKWRKCMHPAAPMEEKVLSSSLKRELAQMKTQPKPPLAPPPPPAITEISAPCENVITNSDLRVRKADVITKNEPVITKNEPVITEKILKNMPKGFLSFTESGMRKLEAEAKCRAKKGQITTQTYEKKMQRVGEAKRFITQATGQTEMIFL